MPFIKKQLTFGEVSLSQIYLPREVDDYAQVYETVIQQAQEKANYLNEQAKYNAEQLLSNSERLLIQTKQEITQLKQQAHTEIAHIKEQAVNEAVLEAQEMVINQAFSLIEQLHKQAEQFKSDNLPFVHQLLKDVVDSLLKNLDAKTQVLIMAEKLANKALQLEQGTLSLNPVHEANLPKLTLPSSWKLTYDALLLEDEAKLSAGGSEWRTQFSIIEQTLLQWFTKHAPENVLKTQNTLNETTENSILDLDEHLDEDLDENLNIDEFDEN
jgi:hypothetical protein